MKRDDCLNLLRNYVDEDDIASLERANSLDDQKTWDFAVERALDKFTLKKKQAIRDVGVEVEFKNNVDRVFAEDPVIIRITKKLEKETRPSKKIGLRRKLQARRVRLAKNYANAMMDDSGFIGHFGITSLYKEDLANYNTLTSKMSEAIHSNSNVFGRVVRVMTEEHKLNLARAAWGRTDVMTKGANEIYDAFSYSLDYGNQRMIKAGSAIQPLDEYRLTNTYDPEKLMAEGKEAFVRDHMNEQEFVFKDNPDIVDYDYLPSENRQGFLEDMYDNIVEGYGPEVPGVTIPKGQGRKLANRENPFRYVNPTTGDAWYKSATKYGVTNNPLESMNRTLIGVAHQITMLEKLGSNPGAMWDGMLAGLRKLAGGDNSVGTHADDIFKNLNAPSMNPHDTVIRLLQGARDFESQHLLGSAALSATSDIAFSINTAIFNGISPFKVVGRHMKGLADGKSIKDAQALGLISHEALQVAGADHRLADSGSNGLIRRSVNFMLKASGLNRWTNAGKAAFGMEFLHETAKIIKGGKPNRKLAEAYKRYGIDIGELQSLRDSTVTRKGVEFANLSAHNLAQSDIMKRLNAMTQELMQAAIPEPGISVRTRMTAGTMRGTRSHEALKTLTQFLSFPATTAIRGYQRLVDASIPMGSRVGHAAGMFIGATALGGMVVQAKRITKGKEIREVDDPKFWAESIMQGGAFGFIADAVFSTHPLFGPPTVRRVSRLKDLMMGSFEEDEFLKLAEDWHMELVKGAATTAKEATGFATNLWYTKMLFEKTIFNAVENMADPNSMNQIGNLKQMLYNTNPGQEYIR